jgi:hypothetical protein
VANNAAGVSGGGTSADSHSVVARTHTTVSEDVPFGGRWPRRALLRQRHAHERHGECQLGPPPGFAPQGRRAEGCHPSLPKLRGALWAPTAEQTSCQVTRRCEAPRDGCYVGHSRGVPCPTSERSPPSAVHMPSARQPLGRDAGIGGEGTKSEAPLGSEPRVVQPR